jgi:hypothetical protein
MAFRGNINASLLGGNNTDTGVNNIQYTASSATAYRPRSVSTTRPSGIAPPSTIWASLGDRRQRHRIERLCRHACSDIVGNIRVDQAWGLFQLSAARHEVSARTTRSALAASRPRFPKSAATPKPSGAVR